jgi:hypothetical protein
VVDHLLADPVAGRQYRDARRVGAHHLGGDAPHGLVHGHLLDPGEERLPRGRRLFELQGPRLGQVDARRPLHRAGGRHQGLQPVDERPLGLVVVPVGDPGADPAGVRRADVHVPLGAQPLRGLIAGDAERPDVDREHQRVEVERRRNT